MENVNDAGTHWSTKGCAVEGSVVPWFATLARIIGFLNEAGGGYSWHVLN
jgi:hypothetical protein